MGRRGRWCLVEVMEVRRERVVRRRRRARVVGVEVKPEDCIDGVD